MIPPPTSLLDLQELEGPNGQERLARTVNEFLTPVGSGLSNGLTFTDNFTAYTFTTPFLFVASDWLPLTLANGWTPLDTPAITKLPSGLVLGMGVVTGGTIGSSPVAQLSAPYRPVTPVNCPCASSNAYGQIDVQIDGRLIPVAGSTAWVSLSGLRYMAADRTPVPASCWPYTFVLPDFFQSRPKHVLVTEIREKDNNAGFAVVAPHWDFTILNGKPAIKIMDVPGLPAGKSYKLTFLVVAS